MKNMIIKMKKSQKYATVIDNSSYTWFMPQHDFDELKKKLIFISYDISELTGVEDIGFIDDMIQYLKDGSEPDFSWANTMEKKILEYGFEQVKETFIGVNVSYEVEKIPPYTNIVEGYKKISGWLHKSDYRIEFFKK